MGLFALGPPGRPQPSPAGHDFRLSQQEEIQVASKTRCHSAGAYGLKRDQDKYIKVPYNRGKNHTHTQKDISMVLRISVV